MRTSHCNPAHFSYFYIACGLQYRWIENSIQDLQHQQHESLAAKNTEDMFKLFRNINKELEEARTKLEKDLRSHGMEFLIEKMNSKEIYSPLLNKKRKSEISSTDDVSWYAYRRATELNNKEHKEELLKLLSTCHPEIKHHILYALSHLCNNTNDLELFNFLIDILSSQRDYNCQLSILSGIEKMKKPKELNIEPIKKLAIGKGSDIKIAAITALQNTEDSEVEPLLLEIFKNAKDSHLKDMICTPLESIGTQLSIPILEDAYKKTRDSVLRNSIEITLELIKKRNSAANTVL